MSMYIRIFLLGKMIINILLLAMSRNLDEQRIPSVGLGFLGGK